MFPDSAIAAKFACGERKCNYLAAFGIAPHFQNLLQKRVSSSQEYVLLFDESLNPALQEKQMDVMVRLWDVNQVSTRYYTSKFLGHAYADTLQEELYGCCMSVGLRGLLQVSMDGPNVNWKAFRQLNNQIEAESRRQLLNVGSCGLHTIHNSFKSGWLEIDWDVQHAFTSLYWLFKDSPARREDYSTSTGSYIFPKRFCRTRWVENVDVAERVLNIWPHVENFVQAIQAGRFKKPQTKYWSTIVECCSDPLFLAKVNIFLTFTKDFTPFLVKYQSDLPLLPFIADDLVQLLRTLLGRFVKSDILSKINGPMK